MNKDIIRLTGGFLVLVGLAYVGHQVFVQPSTDAVDASATTAPSDAKATAAAPAGMAGPVGGTNAYAVYPDRATEKALGLDYATFSGNFAQDVTITPLPPHFPGATMLRVLPGQAQALDISLNDLRCESSVHVAAYRVNDKVPLASAALDAKTAKLAIPFENAQVPAVLLEIRMDEKAKNNYWCGVTVRWTQPEAPKA